MTAEEAYQFFKPHLERFTSKERKRLSELILREEIKPKARRKKQRVTSVEQYERELLARGFFKYPKARIKY